MKPVIVILVSLLSFAAAIGQQPPSADSVLKEAGQEARREGKKVFIIFHASWCGWCKKMDQSMADKSVKNFFDDNYVVRHLTVYESKGNEGLENPGAEALLKKYRGADQGIPYWMIFSTEGELLADSKMRAPGEGLEAGDNSGCPASEKEVDYFVGVLKATSPLKDTELEMIRKRFRQNEPAASRPVQ